MALQKIQIPNFLGGIAPSRYTAGINQFQGTSRGIDLWRTTTSAAGTARIGNVAPGWTSTAVTGVASVTTTITKFVPSDTTSDTLMLYGYSATKIYRLDTSNDTITTTGGWPYTITNGAPGGMALYRGSMYYANGSTQVGTFTPGSAPTFTDNTLTGFASSVRSRPMIVFQNQLYIGNGNQIYQRNGTTNTANAFVLETGYEIDHFATYKKYLVWSASKNTNTTSAGTSFNIGTKIWFWDTSGAVGGSSFANFEFTINESRIRGMQEINGKLYVLGFNFLYQFDGNGFTPIFNFQSSSNNVAIGSGLLAGNNSLAAADRVEQMNIWKNFLIFSTDSEVCTYGSLDPSIPSVVCAPWTLTDAGGVSGARDDKVYVSAGSSNRLVVFSGGNASPQLDTGYINFPGKVRIKGIRFHTAPFNTGQTLIVSFLYDSGSGNNTINFGTKTGGSTAVSELFFTPLTQDAVSSGFFRFDFSGGGGSVIKPPIDIFYEPVGEPFTDVS